LEQINKPQMFIRQESRDAHAVIRGFVYQVERTILAWLNLDKETFLYCECGEDIDYVRQLIDKTSGKSIEERLLEQVKYRQEVALSLKSKEILETIANFIIHKQNNPQHQLKLRFFTNARPAKEKGIPFPRGLSGLEAWEQIRTSNYDPVDTQTTTAYIQRIITESVSTLSLDGAQPLVDFLSSSDERTIIDELIIPVEWSMGNENAQELQPLIETKITAHEYAKELFDQMVKTLTNCVSVDLSYLLVVGILIQKRRNVYLCAHFLLFSHQMTTMLTIGIFLDLELFGERYRLCRIMLHRNHAERKPEQFHDPLPRHRL